MRYKLIDVKKMTEEDVLFGTCELCELCELCEYMGTNFYEILVFQDELGEIYHVENGAWVLGDYFTFWWIDNYVHFADFIHNRDYPLPMKDKYGEYYFESIVDEMYQDYDELEELDS